MKEAPQNDADVLSRYVELSELILKYSEKIKIKEDALEAVKSERARIKAGLFAPNNGHSLEICDKKKAALEAECEGLRLELEGCENELPKINERRYALYGLRPKYAQSYT